MKFWPRLARQSPSSAMIRGNKLKVLVVTAVVVLVVLKIFNNTQLNKEFLENKASFQDKNRSIDSNRFQDNQFHIANNSYKCDGKWVQWYKKFHADSLNSTEKNRRFLVFYCPGHGEGCGGYGNRMVGLISTFYLSILLDRVFMMHWGGPEKFETFLLPNQIDWRLNESKFEGLSFRSHYWGVSQPGGYDELKIQSEADFQNWIKEVELRSLFDHQVVKFNTIWYYAESLWKNRELKKRAKELELPPDLVTYPYAMIGCAMKFLFKKTTYLMKEFSKEKSRMGPRERPMIGIHIRTNDLHWGSSNQKSRRTSAPERVFLCAQRVEKALKKKFISLRKKSFTWFLAADDKNLKLKAQAQFPSNVVTLDIKPRHLEINGKDFQNILRDILMDQLMLLECDYFLPTWDSTFSYVVLGLRQFSIKNFVFGEKCPLDEQGIALAP